MTKKSNSNLIGSGQRSRDRQDKEAKARARKFEALMAKLTPVKK